MFKESRKNQSHGSTWLWSEADHQRGSQNPPLPVSFHGHINHRGPCQAKYEKTNAIKLGSLSQLREIFLFVCTVDDLEAGITRHV